MPVIRWRPSEDFQKMRNDMERKFNKFYRSMAEDSEGVCDCYPLVDIEETKDDFIIYAELPGISKDAVKISMADDTLTLSGEIKEPENKEDRKFHRLERSYGRFQRSFYLPMQINGDKVKAAFKDGILTVTLPKKEEVKPKEISISVA